MRPSSYFLLVLALLIQPLRALTIQINYDFDTEGFFEVATNPDAAEAKAALEAAANRFSEVITTSLSVVNSTNSGAGAVPATDPDWRIGFAHPGTGANYEISAAPSAAADDLVGSGSAAADLYDPNFGIAADTWILFAGGRSLAVAGSGGTGTGTNFAPAAGFPGVFLEAGSVLNREWKGDGATYSQTSLPVWGGAISFDNDGTTDWHYDHTSLKPGNEADFYSIAVHEIGHALGLSSDWSEFTDLVSGGQFIGTGALTALDADNGTSGTTGINLVGGTNFHFEDGTYQSLPFENGSSPAAGVNAKELQDLVLEPTANFSPTERRFELTNVEVAALQDIGWEVIPEPSSAGLVLIGISLLARRRRKVAA